VRVLDVVEFLHILGASSIEASADAEWVRSSCPLAEYTHSKGRDRRPSFGIKVNPIGESSVHCFTCGSSNLAGLVHRITWLKGYNPKIHKFYADHECFYADLLSTVYNPSFSVPVTAVPVAVPYIVIESYPLIAPNKKYSAVTAFELNKMEKWFIGRNIDIDIVRSYQIRMDVVAGNIIFPIKDVDYKTYHLHARSRTEKLFFFYTADYLQQPKPWGRKDFWFGIEHVDFSKPVILVESETDVLRLRTLGIDNVMAACGGVGSEKLKRVISNIAILGFDSDEPGARYCSKAIGSLHSSAGMIRLSWKTVGAKDAGDLKSLDDWNKVWENRKIVRQEGGKIILSPVKSGIEYPDKFADVKAAQPL